MAMWRVMVARRKYTRRLKTIFSNQKKTPKNPELLARCRSAFEMQCFRNCTLSSSVFKKNVYTCYLPVNWPLDTAACRLKRSATTFTILLLMLLQFVQHDSSLFVYNSSVYCIDVCQILSTFCHSSTQHRCSFTFMFAANKVGLERHGKFLTGSDIIRVLEVSF